MKKLKFLNPETRHKIFVSIFMILLITQTKAANNIDTCGIDNFIVVDNKYHQSVSLPRAGLFRKGFSKKLEFCQSSTFHGNRIDIIFNQYILDSNNQISMGKGKIQTDSMLCIKINNRKNIHYFFLKKKCTIKLIGYKIFTKTQMTLYFYLITNDCKLTFSIEISRHQDLIYQFG